MPSGRVMPLLSGLLALAMIGKGGAVIAAGFSGAEPDRSNDAAPNFDELDLWEEQLAQRSREIEAKHEGAKLVLAEAERAAAVAKSNQERSILTIDSAKKLATVYGAMDPKKAAETLAALPTDKSAAVIAEMAPDVAGPIIAVMPKAASHQIAAYLLDAP